MLSGSTAVLPQWLINGRLDMYCYQISSVLAFREQERRSWESDGKKFPEHYSKAVGSLKVNQSKNRYRDILPYDHTRVVVGDLRQDAGQAEKYLNGNWVREFYGGKLWIATQAPLADTIHDFFSVIAKPIVPSSPAPAIFLPSPTQVCTVVQLTLNRSGGQEYFPSKVGATMTIKPDPAHNVLPLEVTLLERDWIEEAKCYQSKLSFVPTGANTGRPVVFTHLLYMAWPDHGVPQKKYEASLLELVRLADRINKEQRAPDSMGDDPPAIVHCSAGIGRTGTFIALSSLLRAHGLLSTPTPSPPSPPTPATVIPSPLPPFPRKDDPVALEIDSLREQRLGMVETPKQLALIYRILELAFGK